MIIYFKTKKLEKICSDLEVCLKRFSPEMSVKIKSCIDAMRAAPNVWHLCNNKILGCHNLNKRNKKNNKGEYAMHLVEPYRMVFRFNKKDCSVLITEIGDYH